MGKSSDIRDTFFMECEELLEALSDGLNDIQRTLPSGRTNPETVNAVFRSVHSIKGGAGAFGLEALVRFAHHFETTLAALRGNTVSADTTLIALFFRSSDHLSDLVHSARDDLPADTMVSADLIARLEAVVGQAPDLGEAADFGFVPMAISLGLDPQDQELAEPTGFRILFTPHKRLFLVGHDPAVLFRVLAEMGDLTVEVDSAALPEFDTFSWQESYLRWTLTLATAEPEHTILEVFEFVEGLCDLGVTPLRPDRKTDTTDPPPETARGVDQVPAHQANGPTRPLVDRRAVVRKPPTPPKATVRVELERVDRLINLVGELVINQAMLSQCVHQAGISPRSDIGTGLDDFRNLSREIQESVMAIRAQPIKPLFQRMERIIRESSETAGKKVRLETSGEFTEVDKTLIERLADPLTHMIRNAIDHGIEPEAVRVQAGKPVIGTVSLSAEHRSGRVLIEVADDGAGINRKKVLQIAVDKGLIARDLDLGDPEIDKLLFLPGFSTASQVSDLSGRGVGMDVVKSAIQALGGRVAISSDPGHGTVMAISLPLTLAVLDGMIVEIAGETMVVPITAILETLRPTSKDLHSIASGGQVVAIRGKFIPIVDLGAAFGHRDARMEFAETVLLLVETGQEQKFALAVDAIIDQRQVVIKGLEENYGHIVGVAAATILGDGKIALIIDPEDIVANAPHPTATRTQEN